MLLVYPPTLWLAQALVAIGAVLGVGGLQAPLLPRIVRRAVLALGIVFFVTFGVFETLGPYHGTGYSPTGVLLFRAFGEDKLDLATMARIVGFQLPPSARQPRSLVSLTWNGDGLSYYRFEVDPRDADAVEAELTSRPDRRGSVMWDAEDPGIPLEWWDVSPSELVQSTRHNELRYAIHRRAASATVYVVRLAS